MSIELTAEALGQLPVKEMEQRVYSLNSEQTPYAEDWPFWQRADQKPPESDWRVWLVMAGRGYGKTRMGAEWARAKALSHPECRIALVAATMAEARNVMVEGDSGILSLAPDDRPEWRSSLGQIRWSNGSVISLYSAAEPDGLRGLQHDFAWADEIAKWHEAEAAFLSGVSR